jgi:outer membrane lipoprotein-sorting protein
MPLHTSVPALLALCLAAGVACAADVPKTDAPKAAAPKADALSDIDEVLEKFAAAGKDIRRVSSDLTETFVDDLVGATRSRQGRIFLVKDGDVGRIRIDLFGGRAKKTEETYVFDGNTFWKVNHKSKQILGFRQAPGQAKDVFKIGRGPFPLPIGQPREDIQKMFETALLSRKGVDPVVVKLVPKPSTPFARDFKEFEFSARLAEGIPFKVVSRKGGQDKTIELTPLINEKAVIPADAFVLDPDAPEFKGFSVEIKAPGRD